QKGVTPQALVQRVIEGDPLRRRVRLASPRVGYWYQSAATSERGAAGDRSNAHLRGEPTRRRWSPHQRHWRDRPRDRAVTPGTRQPVRRPRHARLLWRRVSRFGGHRRAREALPPLRPATV